tara:strand:- start:62 stop:1039 length:978 start_codon:yes stop_codon:yes gene_type:complete
MFDHFYHQIFRKTVIAFGTLFNGIEINRDGNEIIKVPLAYGPTQKFLARIEQQPDLNKPIQISLPRMSFEFTGVSYDNGRKLATTQAYAVAPRVDKKDIKKMFFPVPYNMEFELNIMTLLNDDALQIVEQILPYFQPNFNLTIDLIESIGESRDIPITLENVSFQDNYEGDYASRRVLLYTLKFTAKTFLFGPVPSSSKDIITRVSVGLGAGTPSPEATRSITYTTPRATKAYNGNAITNIAEDLSSVSSLLKVDDDQNIPVKSYITIDDETMYVTSKNDGELTVDRGVYRTSSVEHVEGTGVLLITAADNSSIEAGDDFGFDGN